jgi:hypothetical protein
MSFQKHVVRTKLDIYVFIFYSFRKSEHNFCVGFSLIEYSTDLEKYIHHLFNVKEDDSIINHTNGNVSISRIVDLIRKRAKTISSQISFWGS